MLTDHGDDLRLSSCAPFGRHHGCLPGLVGPEGIEPSPSSLSETCTNRLCYGPMLYGWHGRIRTHMRRLNRAMPYQSATCHLVVYRSL
jgi:hypothetical protein